MIDVRGVLCPRCGAEPGVQCTTSSHWPTADHSARVAVAERKDPSTCPVPGCGRTGFVRVKSHIFMEHPEHFGGQGDR